MQVTFVMVLERVRKITKFLVRKEDLHEGPGKDPFLPKSFLNGREFSCHITQIKSPKQSKTLVKIPERTESFTKVLERPRPGTRPSWRTETFPVI